MADFALTEEQRALKDTVKKFAEKEIKPVAAELDKLQDPKEAGPKVAEIIKKGLQLGFGKIAIPVEYGGIGGGPTETNIMAEELAVADLAVAMTFSLSAVAPRMVALGGTEEQKEKWVRPSGEDETGKYIWAGAATEPTGGNEIMCPLPDPSFGVRTTATRDGDGYRIKGQKCFVSGAGVAEVYFVLARTRKDKPNFEGCNMFLFHKDTPGYSIGKIEDKVGSRLSMNGEMFFDDMWVPKEDMLGEEGAGLQLIGKLFKAPTSAGLLIGLARAAYNEALKFSRERIIWGKPTIEYQAVASRLVRMRMKIEAGRALVARLVWAAENPSLAEGLDKITAMSKVYLSEMAQEVASDAMYLLGGYGYMKEYPVEKYLRDSLMGRVIEGANEMYEWLMSFDLQPL